MVPTNDTSLRYHPLGYFKSEYTVQLTGPEGPTLPPIMFSISTGLVRVQDYLSPGEADHLGDALKVEAARARAKA
jgi:hypothetical protein